MKYFSTLYASPLYGKLVRAIINTFLIFSKEETPPFVLIIKRIKIYGNITTQHYHRLDIQDVKKKGGRGKVFNKSIFEVRFNNICSICIVYTQHHKKNLL